MIQLNDPAYDGIVDDWTGQTGRDPARGLTTGRPPVARSGAEASRGSRRRTPPSGPARPAGRRRPARPPRSGRPRMICSTSAASSGGGTSGGSSDLDVDRRGVGGHRRRECRCDVVGRCAIGPRSSEPARTSIVSWRASSAVAAAALVAATTRPLTTSSTSVITGWAARARTTTSRRPADGSG